MSLLVITYDLNKERNRKDDYDKIYAVLKTFEYTRLSESSYAIVTVFKPDVIYRQFVAADALDKNDDFYVIQLSPPVAGQGPPEKNQWIQRHLEE